ncbi:hypothetical protein PVAP13_5NG060208 [Panicum virgatum]|uniref:Uncharacterized protein n=1 Tax=Panicum virgatum TaxID=38727 RepID=A0A8T0RNV9_PANVG|nr:hypothetical protein PVAP13_5NG060208 [Panicum virgatum]
MVVAWTSATCNRDTPLHPGRDCSPSPASSPVAVAAAPLRLRGESLRWRRTRQRSRGRKKRRRRRCTWRSEAPRTRCPRCTRMPSRTRRRPSSQRRAMENIYQWLSSQHEEATEVPVAAVLTFLQNEIEHRTEESLASPQHAGPQPAYNAAANVHCHPFSFGTLLLHLTLIWMKLTRQETQASRMLFPALYSKISTRII